MAVTETKAVFTKIKFIFTLVKTVSTTATVIIKIFTTIINEKTMKLKETLWRMLHSKHAHTMKKIRFVHPAEWKDEAEEVKNEEQRAKNDGGISRQALDTLCSYVEGQSGHIAAWCDPVTGRWTAVLKDFAGRYLMRAKADTPLQLVDLLCLKIEKKRLREKEHDFNEALDEEGGSNG